MHHAAGLRKEGPATADAAEVSGGAVLAGYQLHHGIGRRACYNTAFGVANMFHFSVYLQINRSGTVGYML